MSTVRKFWFSCERFTVLVEVDDADGTILWTAPIARKFVGRPVGTLAAWMKSLDGFQQQLL